MATAIAERIVGKLIAASAVEEVDRELYVYGFFLLITRFFFFLVTVVFGFSLKIPYESVVFYIVFILMRSYAGGVHAKTEMACTVWTTVAMGSAVVIIKILEVLNGKTLLILIFSDLCILRITPLDTNEKPLTEQDKRWYRKICYVMVATCNLIIIAGAVLSIPLLCYPVVCSMLLEAILLVIGKNIMGKNYESV